MIQCDRFAEHFPDYRITQQRAFFFLQRGEVRYFLQADLLAKRGAIVENFANAAIIGAEEFAQNEAREELWQCEILAAVAVAVLRKRPSSGFQRDRSHLPW